MKKTFLSLVSVSVFLLSFSVPSFADNIMPGTSFRFPNHSFSGFDVGHKLSGQTNGFGDAVAEGDETTTDSYSTGTTDGSAQSEINITKFGPGGNCDSNCADNRAKLHTKMDQVQDSGAYSLASGKDSAHTFAGTGIDMTSQNLGAIDKVYDHHDHDDNHD